MRKGRRSWESVLARNSRNTESKHGETQSYNFCAFHSFGNPNVCITAVKWHAYDVENTVGKARRRHLGRPVVKNSSRFHPGDRVEVFMWQNFQSRLSMILQVEKTEISGTEPTLSYVNLHRICSITVMTPERTR